MPSLVGSEMCIRETDYWYVPHLRPKPDMVIADHVFRQPVVMMRKGDIFFALIPDLELLEEAYESGPARYYLDFVLSGGENRSPAVCFGICLLYTSDAADDLLCVDLGGRRI